VKGFHDESSFQPAPKVVKDKWKSWLTPTNKEPTEANEGNEAIFNNRTARHLPLVTCHLLAAP